MSDVTSGHGNTKQTIFKTQMPTTVQQRSNLWFFHTNRHRIPCSQGTIRYHSCLGFYMQQAPNDPMTFLLSRVLPITFLCRFSRLLPNYLVSHAPPLILNDRMLEFHQEYTYSPDVAAPANLEGRLFKIYAMPGIAVCNRLETQLGVLTSGGTGC